MFSPRKFAWILVLPVLTVCLEACSAFSSTPTPQASPSPATETSTVLWFPATNTPTTMPTSLPPPTPEALPGIGGLLFQDDFNEAALWNIAASSSASAQLEDNRLILSLTSGPLTIASLRSEPTLGDFYASVVAKTSLCRGQDKFGILFRAASPGNLYRFLLTCDGNIRLERVRGGAAEILQNWTPSGDSPVGSPAEVKIGVWASGVEMRFLLNDRYQFSLKDPLFRSGTLGFFATASGDTPVIVSFSDLEVYSVAYVSPTPTLTPTPTQAPTQTPKP